ncbi:MAG: hypothetical protein K2M12_10650 [Muribaculaceae bacterium]|nr:hypothetical protein [Muribaculaceae bacterium]
MSHTILKKRVDLSNSSFFITCLVLAAVLGIAFSQYTRNHNSLIVWVLFGLLLVWSTLNVIYMPMRPRRPPGPHRLTF